jgi:hypothetical protein
MKTKYDKAREIEAVVRKEYLDDDCDAADIALSVIEEEPEISIEDAARRVAMLISQP